MTITTNASSPPAGNPASQIMNKAQPLFISQSEAFKFAVGDVITLPCEVTQPGEFYSVVWRLRACCQIKSSSSSS